MATKKKSTPEDKKNSLTVCVRKDENVDTVIAATYSMPETLAGYTIQKWQNPRIQTSIDINEIIGQLKEQSKALKSDDMSRAESMLLAQAHTLDELFNNLAIRAHQQDYLPNFESFLKLAFKAQNQCRMTLETLSNIKNPPVVYARQANFSGGHQQINNGISDTHTSHIQKQQNELLGVNHGKTLDNRATREAITSNPSMETLE